MCARDASERPGPVGISFVRRLEEAAGTNSPFRRDTAQFSGTLYTKQPRFQVPCSPAGDARAVTFGQPDLELNQDLPDNLVLQSENIFYGPVVPLDPKMVAFNCVDELNRATHPFASGPDAASKNISDPEGARDLPYNNWLPLE